ncbi:MAG: HNH endonuclease, partial [Chloroflexota bacterium]
GIDQWARRVRELRVEQGWSIVNGTTAKEMAEEDEFPIPEIALQMRPDDYILLSTQQDRDAAHRWNIAKQIRQEKGSVRSKILHYLRENVGRPVSGEELRYVAGDVTEWARRVRELRTEDGWPIVTKQSGRPDLPVGMYVLEQDRQSPAHDRHISDITRRLVLERDHYSCRRCGWTHEKYNRSDPRHLELHHIIHHEKGGENTADNLITLCTVCHDEWHSVELHNSDTEFEAWVTIPPSLE